MLMYGKKELRHRAALLCCGLAGILLGGCSDLDLGEIPFTCNPGEPKCPDGYVCTADVCHREGECPSSIKECPHFGKFCNGLQKSDGSKFTMTFKIGEVELKALTGTCSSCVTLPEGKSAASLQSEGQILPDLTGTITLDKTKDYVFISTLDSANKVDLGGLKLNPGDSCKSLDPFKKVE